MKQTNKNLHELFETEPMYYYNTWINGNKSHLKEHVIMFLGTPYGLYIIGQFVHDPQAYNEMISFVFER